MYPAGGPGFSIEDRLLCSGNVTFQGLYCVVVTIEHLIRYLAQDKLRVLPVPIRPIFDAPVRGLQHLEAPTETQGNDQVLAQKDADPAQFKRLLTGLVACAREPDTQQLFERLYTGPPRVPNCLLHSHMVYPEPACERVEFFPLWLVDDDACEAIWGVRSLKCILYGFSRGPAAIGVDGGVDDHGRTIRIIVFPSLQTEVSGYRLQASGELGA